MEDRYAFHPHTLPTPAAGAASQAAPDGMLVAAVMDGHGGWQVSEHARRTLPEAIVRELDHAASYHDPQQVALAMGRAYQRVDRAFIDAVRGAYAQGFGDVARVGACAVSAVITPRFVVVANAGDCRAVLGRVWKHAPAGTDDASEVFVTATPLSHDHNARMPREATKLAAAHPGESDIVVCRSPTACYVKGRLQPTRALGDAYLKYSEFNGPPGSASRSWGRHIPPPYTPPYITSSPEVRCATSHERERERARANGGGDSCRLHRPPCVQWCRLASTGCQGTGLGRVGMPASPVGRAIMAAVGVAMETAAQARSTVGLRRRTACPLRNEMVP